MRGGKGGWWWKGILWAGGLLRPEARVLWAGKAFGGQRGEQRGMAPAACDRGGGQVGGVASGGGGAYYGIALCTYCGDCFSRRYYGMSCVGGGEGLGDYYGMVVQNGEGLRRSSPTAPPTPLTLLPSSLRSAFFRKWPKENT